MDRYAILSNLGSGTFGEVYKARHRRTGTVVAIKRLRLRCPSFADALQLAEVSSLRRLSASSGRSHRNIVQILEIIRETSGALQLVFEYMADGNLYDLIRRASAERAAMQQQRQQNGGVGGVGVGGSNQQQILTHPRIQSIISQVLSGLAYMNSRSYFHRDLKPENILISGSTAKIADMGLAKTHAAGKFTSYVSTRWYRGPELLLRSPRYTKTIDSFAVGCIVAELYNLAPLFPGSNELDQLWKEMSVIGAPTDDAWPEGVRLAKRLSVTLPTIVPYERRREYELEQRRVQQLLLEAEQRRRQQQQQQQGGGNLTADAAVASPSRMMMTTSNAILHIPLDKIMRTAPASAQRLTAALLVMNPAKRLDAAEALRHEYFAPPRTNSYNRGRGHRPTAPPPRRAKDDRIVGKTGGLAVGVSVMKKRGHSAGDDRPLSAAAKAAGAALEVHAEVGRGGGVVIFAGGRPEQSQQGSYHGQSTGTVASTRGEVLPEHAEEQHVCQSENGDADIRPSHPQKKRRLEIASDGTHHNQQQLKDVSSNMNSITPVEGSSSSFKGRGGFNEWLLAGTKKKEGSANLRK